MVSAQTRKQEHNTTMLVNVLSQIVEFRNGESGSHVRHIRILTEKVIAQLLRKTDKYSLSSEEQDNITLASALHDIGKIAIDEKILNKPGRLTPEEFAVIKTHTTEGAALLHRLENSTPNRFCRRLRHRPLAPRAVGWPGLSGRPGRRRHPHRGAAGLAGRCLRRADQ